VAMPDWIPFGIKATEDYASDGFLKKTSYPYEWIIVENARKIDELDFTKDAKEELMCEYEKIKEKELKARGNILACYNKVCVKQFDNLTTRYDAHVCTTCKNYCYLSYISCGICKRKGCTHHITICDCLGAQMYLMIRFTEKEMNEFSKEIKKTSKKK